MNDKIKEELISLGLNALEEAISHFGDIKGCSQSDALCYILSGAIVLSKSIIKGDE